MRPVRTRVVRAIARVTHFIPHLFIALAPPIMAIQVLALSQPDPVVRVADYDLSFMEWAVVIGFTLLVVIVFVGADAVFHDRACPICERDKIRPRWSRWMWKVGRPWYTPHGPVLWGALANIAVIILAFWVHSSLVLLYWPMLAGLEIGFIAYRRAGGARSEDEAKLRVAATETGDITEAVNGLKGVSEKLDDISAALDEVTELRKDVEKRLG